MKKYFILVLTLTTSMLKAEIIKDRIHSIEDGLIRFENGRIAFLDSQKVELAPDELVEAIVDDKSSLKSLKRLAPSGMRNLKNLSFQPDVTIPPVFEPTVVQGMEEANAIFNRSNPHYKRISECTDRAHIWAHEEFKLSGTKSRKVFVFFTASYINSVRFKWWFHVAPLYTVKAGGLQELVMDYRFTDRPLTVKEWTDEFVYTKRDCKVTTKFSEYDVNPQTENCYLIFESMHYKLPGEIQEQETASRYKTVTTESELKASYHYAFLK